MARSAASSAGSREDIAGVPPTAQPICSSRRTVVWALIGSRRPARAGRGQRDRHPSGRGGDRVADAPRAAAVLVSSRPARCRAGPAISGRCRLEPAGASDGSLCRRAVRKMLAGPSARLEHHVRGRRGHLGDAPPITPANPIGPESSTTSRSSGSSVRARLQRGQVSPRDGPADTSGPRSSPGRTRASAGRPRSSRSWSRRRPADRTQPASSSRGAATSATRGRSSRARAGGEAVAAVAVAGSRTGQPVSSGSGTRTTRRSRNGASKACEASGPCRGWTTRSRGRW